MLRSHPHEQSGQMSIQNPDLRVPGVFVSLESGFSLMKPDHIRSNKTETKPPICFSGVIQFTVDYNCIGTTPLISEQFPSHKGKNRFVYTTNCISNHSNLELKKVIPLTIACIYILLDR